MEHKSIEVISVNLSEKKGTVKIPQDEIIIDRNGVRNDAHSGPWNRQVSLLGTESVERFSKEAGRMISYGEFAENITTKGMELVKTLPLDRFVSDKLELEVTQIGKECHGNTCAIFREVGNCVMPKEGIFARVIRGGKVRPGDRFAYRPRVFRFFVVTLSDRASSGRYEDRSGPAITSMLEDYFAGTNRRIDIRNTVIPDDEEKLTGILNRCRQEGFDFVFTTGGTGVGPRDITPEVAKTFIDREIPGIMENIRVKYGSEKPNALLSRGVAGIMGRTQLYTLPGSVKAVKEYMTEIMKTMEHLVYMLYSIDAH